MLLFFGACTLSSCSDDDAPEANAFTGAQQADFIKSMVLTSKGDIAFTPADAEGVYMVAVDNEDLAYQEASAAAGYLFLHTGTELFTLNDGYGSVQLKKSTEDGIFLTESFQVKGIPSFTLQIVSEAYYHNNNIIPPLPQGYNWVCMSCFKRFPEKCDTCPYCGGVVCQYGNSSEVF